MAEYDSPAKPTAGASKNPSPQAINRSPQATSPNSQASQPSKLGYMQRPPAILPNYGKRWKHGRSLKTNLPRVLLYDNVTQQSILDAQVSYIQSQRSKSKRHLDLNIKSFLLWKERKEKMLQKLTQVHHGQDYAYFELQYYGRILHTNNIIPGNGDNRFGLSNIRGEETGEKAVITTRRENCTQNLRDRLPGLPSALKKELQTKLSSTSLDVTKQSQSGRAIHLPCIKKTFRSQKINNGDDQLNSAPQCFQQRNRKLQIVRKSSKVTISSNLPFDSLRIQDNEFAHNKQASIISSKDIVNNSTSATDENSLNCGAGTTTSNSEKPSTVIKNVTANNNSKKFRRNNNSTPVSDENEINDGVDTAKKDSQKQSIEINKAIEQSNSKDFLQNKQVKIKEAILDKRFLQLQKILFRQCPPSEGFTVLSPSFKKKKSFHY